MNPMTVIQEKQMRAYLNQLLKSGISYDEVVTEMKSYRAKLQKHNDEKKK